MKLNDEIIKNWEKNVTLKITNYVDSQIMWLNNKQEMEDVVFSDDIVDILLDELKETYDCSEYDDFDIIINLRDLQHNRIDEYLDFLKSNASYVLHQHNKKTKICKVCGVEFLGTGKSKFCSNACKQKNKRDKK